MSISPNSSMEDFALTLQSLMDQYVPTDGIKVKSSQLPSWSAVYQSLYKKDELAWPMWGVAWGCNDVRGYHTTNDYVDVLQHTQARPLPSLAQLQDLKGSIHDFERELGVREGLPYLGTGEGPSGKTHCGCYSCDIWHGNHWDRLRKDLGNIWVLMVTEWRERVELEQRAFAKIEETLKTAVDGNSEMDTSS
jgi:hypothetical protein